MFKIITSLVAALIALICLFFSLSDKLKAPPVLPPPGATTEYQGELPPPPLLGEANNAPLSGEATPATLSDISGPQEPGQKTNNKTPSISSSGEPQTSALGNSNDTLPSREQNKDFQKLEYQRSAQEKLPSTLNSNKPLTSNSSPQEQENFEEYGDVSNERPRQQDAGSPQKDSVPHPEASIAGESQSQGVLHASSGLLESNKQQPKKVIGRPEKKSQPSEHARKEEAKAERQDKGSIKQRGSKQGKKDSDTKLPKSGQIIVFSREKGATIRLNAEKPLFYKHLLLSNPDRVVVDLSGIWSINPKGIPQNPLVTNVRFGRFPQKTRVVIDLSRTPRMMKLLLSKDKRRLDVRVDK